MHGRSSLMESLVWLFPFLCVKRREKKREDEREKKRQDEKRRGKMKEKMKRDKDE